MLLENSLERVSITKKYSQLFLLNVAKRAFVKFKSDSEWGFVSSISILSTIENELINVVVEHPTLIYSKKSLLFGSYNHKYQNSYIANFF